MALGLLPGVAFSLGTSPRACADDPQQKEIYDSNGFEPPTFVAGAPLLGVDGWSTAIPPFLNPAAATITNAESRNGLQSVEVRGGDLVSAPLDPGTGMPVTAPYDAVGSYRRPLKQQGYAVSRDKPIVIVEADLLLDTDRPVTHDDFFSLTIAARSGDGETLGEMGLSSSGFAEAYGFDTDPGAPPVFTAPIERDDWHHVSIVMDFSAATTTVSYLLDGELIGVTPTTSTSKVLLRGSMVVYALPDGRGDKRKNYTARFDNFRVSASGAGGDRN